VTVTQATIVGSGFSLSAPILPLPLSAGQTAVFSVSFTPKVGGSTVGSLSFLGSVTTVHDRSGKHNNIRSTTTTVSLNGTGAGVLPASTPPGLLVANPGTLSFAAVRVGSNLTKSAALTNSGGSSVTVAQATIAGAGFSMDGPTLPFTLAAGQSATFTVAFAPVSAGNASGGISISSDASSPALTIFLEGTGAAQGQLAVTPVSANFGAVTVGATKSQKATLTASGSSVTVSSASVTSPEFSLSGIALPLTLAAGQSIPFTLTFTPQQSGTASAMISFASNATNSTAETLTGTGAVPPSHSVNLSWDAAAVVGFNVYRGSQHGGPYVRINPVLVAGPTYVDASVQGGQAYYYVTTAVDSSGAQSGYSNETQATIPSP
jgi:hypothetical protein